LGFLSAQRTVSTQRFKTVVTQSGTRALIVLPFDPNEAWGAKDRHYVAGSINGCRFRGRLESNGREFFLPLGPAWRQSAGIRAGSKVDVALSPEGPQSDALAADITAALEAEPAAKAFFDGLASFYRKNFVRWIEGAKRPETRSARVAEMVTLLKAGRREK
jgi:hypothetical protein